MLKGTGFLSLLALVMSCGGNNAAELKAGKAAAATEHHDEELFVTLTPEQAITAGIETGFVELRTLSGTIKVNGTLDVPPQQLVSVSAPMGGFLQSSTLLQGKKVNKGQVIAVIQDPAYIQLQQDYAESVSQLEYLQAEFERQKALAEENVNAAKNYQQAKANFYAMNAKVNGLKAKLQLLHINTAQVAKGQYQSTINIYAPLTGYVTEVNVNRGKYVNPTDIMFEIVDTEHLHAELTVFEKDVPKLKRGQKVRFILANETKERMATVFLIGREISADRTVRIHCHLDKEDVALLPGMYLTAFVETKNQHVPSIVESAVVNYEGKSYIFVEQKDEHHDGESENEASHVKEEKHAAAETTGTQFKMMEVKTGVAELGYIELVLPANFSIKDTKIVIKGAYDLLSKMKNTEEEGDHHHH